MTGNAPIPDNHLIALRNLVRAYGGQIITRAQAVDLLVCGLVFDREKDTKIYPVFVDNLQAVRCLEALIRKGYLREEDIRIGKLRIPQNALFKAYAERVKRH